MTQVSTPTNSFSWLHLTDFHFGLKDQNFLWSNLRQPFLDDLARVHEQTGSWQAVLFTGDLVQQGKSAEFQKMQKEVLNRLWEKLAELGSGDAILLAVPGNHDLYRPNPKEDNAAIDALLDRDGFSRIASKFWDNPSGAYRRVINDAFAAYSEWWQNAPHRPSDITKGILPGDFACTFECGEQRIGIIGLNTAFLQLQGGDYQGKLVWDTRQLHAVCGGAVDDWINRHSLCLLLTHQGSDWLAPDAKKHGETEIAPAGRFALHLYGHMHEADLNYIHTGGNTQATRLYQGCSVFGMEKFGEPPAILRSHGYAAGRIDFNSIDASLRIWPRIATDKPNGTGWRYIPDNTHLVLADGLSTAPEIIPLHILKTSTPVKTTCETKPAVNPVAPFSPHSTLPSPREFFGRVDELAAIARFLQPNHTGWGVVLDGPGGIGKTSLALEAAHRAPAEYYPLKLFITAKKSRMDADGEHRLQDNRVDDYFTLLTEIGLALGRDEVQRTPPEQRVELIRHALASQRVLLVLDNLESFTHEERRRIYDLLEVLPSGCRAIVTSRRRDETSARILRLDKLDVTAAKQLLAALGKKNPAIAKLTEDEQQRLYAETGGNPLLLTWTATQLGRVKGRCHKVEEAVQRLIAAHKHNDPLEFVFGDLLDTFTDDETKVLAALAYFTEPARLAWLLPLAELSVTAALTALDDLRDRALLIEDETNDSWFLPPLAARFLRLRRPGAIASAGQRLENEAYTLAVQYGGDNNYPYIELEAVWSTIQAALPLLIAGDNNRLQKFCDAMYRFLDFTGRWNERLSLSLEAETKANATGDYKNAGWRSYDAGYVYGLQGAADAVLNCSERCQQYFHLAGSGAYQQAYAIRLRGIAYRLQKDYVAAIEACQHSVDLLRTQNPESVHVVRGIDALANIKKDARDLKGAEEDYREALRIAQKLDYREGIAYITGNLAELALDRQDWITAERLATEALKLIKGVGRLQIIADNHHTLAQALLRQKRANEALPHTREAVAIFTQLHSCDLAKAETTLAECEAACV